MRPAGAGHWPGPSQVALDRALSQSDDAISVAFGKSLVVRYDDDETVLGDGGEGVHGTLPAREVKRARGFVCEQDARFLDYGPGDGDALGLSARELAGHPVLEARQANGLERLGHSCVWTTADKALEVSEANRSSHPVYSYPDNKRVQTGWQESIEYTVKSQDFAALNRLIAQSQKDAEVQNTHFTLSPQKRNAAVDEASRTALLRFKDRAAALAQTLGFSGYKIVSLKLGELGDAPVMMMSAKAGYATPMAADSATAAPPSPGIEEIRITVNGSVQM